jgi:hypothetical protein
MHARLVAVGLRPILRRLDNECSVALKHIYLLLKAWTINFFLHLWDKLIPQAELTLNSLCGFMPRSTTAFLI